MNSKKSFKNLVKKMEALQEDKQGKLKGGFSAFSVSPNNAVGGNNTNVNNATSCYCSCTLKEQ